MSMSERHPPPGLADGLVAIRPSAMALCAVLITAAGMGTAAHAGPLRDAFDAALMHDATFQAARFEWESARQGLPMARAALRPNVSLSVSDAKVLGARTGNTALGQPVTTDLDYHAPSQSLNLRWPLYHREAQQRVGQAERQQQHAEAVLAVRTGELADRLATAYLQALLAEHGLRLAGAQVDLAEAQQAQARSQLARGEGTRPEVAEAEATLALAQVQRRDADDQRRLARLALQHIAGAGPAAALGSTPTASTAGGVVTGTAIGVVAAPAAVVGPAPLPTPGAPWSAMPAWPTASLQLDDLLARADANNPVVAARRRAVAVAQAAVERNEAGHYPRLDLVASASAARNESVSTLNQTVRQRTLSLQFNLPLYGGGYVSAAVKQAQADLDKARAELQAEQLALARELSKLALAVAQGDARIAAHHQAVAGSALALEGARKTLAAGLGAQGNVALAQRKLAQAQHDLAQAAYEAVLDRLRLQVRSGAEPRDVLALVDALLAAWARP